MISDCKPLTPLCSANYTWSFGNEIKKFNTSSLIHCNYLGASLLSIPDIDTSERIKTYVKHLEDTRSYYKQEFTIDANSYWTGGIVEDTRWYWIDNGKNFSSFSNWKNSRKNFGCVGGICTNNFRWRSSHFVRIAFKFSILYEHEIMVFFDRLQIDATRGMVWTAQDKSKRSPYICRSHCDVGYHYLESAMACVKIYKSSPATQSKAMLTCAKEGARLFSLTSCDQVSSLATDFVNHFDEHIGDYWIGFFAEGLNQYTRRRTPDFIRTLNARGYAGRLENCANLLLDDTSTNISSIPPSIDGYHSTLLLSAGSPAKIRLETFQKYDATNPQGNFKFLSCYFSLSLFIVLFTYCFSFAVNIFWHEHLGFLCEKENDWKCPPGYIMFLEHCYWFSNEEISAAEGILKCQEMNAEVTLLRHYHLWW